MQMQLPETYDAEDKFFFIKNNRLIQKAEDQFPKLVRLLDGSTATAEEGR